MSTTPQMNQGEGDRRSAKRYNKNATTHASSGASAEAARQAERAVDREPERHRAAERAGKERAAELDPEVTMPRWWVERDETTWGRIKEAFRRDWVQTKFDLTDGRSGEELDQGLIDTLKQMAGRDPLPPKNEPTGVHLEIAYPPLASRAFELGYNAAGHVTGEWNPQVESMLRDEWQTIAPDAFWTNHRAAVYLGWRHRRRYPDLTRVGKF